MDTTTAAVEIPANADHVFDYLSRIETVPEWATEFVQAFEVQGPSEARARTPFGKVIFRLETDEDTRVIDMRVRPSEGPTALFPTRVVPLAEDRSAYLFTMFRGPEQSEDEFQSETESLRRELQNIVRHFSARGEADRDG